MSAELRQAVCLRIYVGEEKCERDRPLYQAIIHQARQTDIALMTCETITRRGLHGLTRPDTQP